MFYTHSSLHNTTVLILTFAYILCSQMLNVPDLTLRSRAAGRVGVRQPAKTYTGPDIAQVSIYPEILEASLPLRPKEYFQEEDFQLPGLLQDNFQLSAHQEDDLQLLDISEDILQLPDFPQDNLQLTDTQEGGDYQLPGIQEDDHELPDIQEDDHQLPGIQEDEHELPDIQDGDHQLPGILEDDSDLPDPELQMREPEILTQVKSLKYKLKPCLASD